MMAKGREFKKKRASRKEYLRFWNKTPNRKYYLKGFGISRRLGTKFGFNHLYQDNRKGDRHLFPSRAEGYYRQKVLCQSIEELTGFSPCSELEAKKSKIYFSLKILTPPKKKW